MHNEYQTGLAVTFAIVLCLLLFAAVLAIVASMQRDSPRALHTRLLAKILFASALCVLGVLPLWLDSRLPLIHAEGIIHNVHIRGGKDPQTSFELTTTSGAELQLRADGTSPRLRTGQQASLTYQPATGLIRKARFHSPTGEQQGVFNGALLWPWASLAAGLLLLWAAFRKNSRDQAQLTPEPPPI